MKKNVLEKAVLDNDVMSFLDILEDGYVPSRNDVSLIVMYGRIKMLDTLIRLHLDNIIKYAKDSISLAYEYRRPMMAEYINTL